MIDVDELDTQIIDILSRDGRRSNRQVAQDLQVSEGTVRKRLKRLRDENAFKLCVVRDASSMNVSAHAYIRLSVAPSSLQRVAQRIAGLDACGYAAYTAGRYNFVAILLLPSRGELARVIDEEILVLPGVHHVDVREPVSLTKHRYDLVRIFPGD